MLTRSSFAVIATLILGTTSLDLSGAEKIETIIRNVRDRYEKITAMQADFSQTVVWALANEEQKTSGKLYLASGDKYRVETEAQIIVTDGKIVWTYAKDKNQVIIDKLTQSEDNPLPRDLLLKYTNAYRAELLGESDLAGTPCYEVKFTPREDDAFIVSTRVWIAKNTWLAVRIEQEDINENVTKYELSNFDLSPTLPGALFTFKIPAAAEVVDLR